MSATSVLREWMRDYLREQNGHNGHVDGDGQR
jgi:hypothetical protein